MEIKVQKTEKTERIDKFLSKKINASRTFVQKQIKEGLILVNKKKIRPNFTPQNGDIIQIEKTEPKTPSIVPDGQVKFKVVHETKNYIVIEKPSGLIVHPAPGIKEQTLADGLAAKYPYLTSVGENMLRPGMVHRIDKEVSGLMVIAKNQKMFEFLKKQFKDRKVNKEYIALAHGKILEHEGSIKTPIGRSKTKTGKMAAHVSQITGDRQAKTKYQVLQKFTNNTLLKVKILTGRTHQIRVHLNSIGHPVVGDELYTNKKIKKTSLGRIFLHASKLSFEDLDGTKKTYSSNLPKEFIDFLNTQSIKKKNSLKLKKHS